MLIKICAPPQLNQSLISNWSVRPTAPDRIWYVRQNVPIWLPVITRLLSVFLPSPSKQWKHTHCMLMMHVWAEPRDCLGQYSSANRLYFVYSFLFVYDFLHTPWAPLATHPAPISLFGLEYPVGTFHFLFSLLKEAGWRGMHNGPQNCSEQTWMFQRLCQKERAKCRSLGREAKDGGEHIKRKRPFARMFNSFSTMSFAMSLNGSALLRNTIPKKGKK